MRRSIHAAALLLVITAGCREPPATETTAPAPEPRAPAADAAVREVSAPSPSPLQAFQPFPAVDAADPLDLELPLLGPLDPLLVILETVDYACPHTRALQPRLEELLAARPEVALYVLHNPLPEHPAASVLAAAVSAAQLQGRFPELHRALLAEPEVPDRERLMALARRLGMDVPRLLADMRREDMRDHVSRNRVVAGALGVQGTPVLYVGGVPIQGIPPPGRLEGLVEDRLEKARALRSAGLSSREVHDSLAEAWTPYGVVTRTGIRFDDPQRAELDPDAVRWDVPVLPGDAIQGAPDAAVTIVAYLDFECPHSRRAWEQLSSQAERPGADLRLVVRAMPHHGGAGSLGSARIFDRARAAGRGIETARVLFGPGGEVLERSPARDPAEVARLLASWRVPAEELAAIGTPTIFVNGLRRAGGLDDEVLEALVEGERELAEELVRKGLPRDRVYRRLTEGGHRRPRDRK